jgi:uncharacterized protein (TIGR00730 family)
MKMASKKEPSRKSPISRKKEKKTAATTPAERRERATADERLLTSPKREETSFTHTDTWRVFRIISEFVEGYELMADVGPAITVFGSARITPKDPIYHEALEVCRLLAEAGYAIITGGGPGIMEAGNRGARLGGSRSVGLNVELAFEQSINPYVDLQQEFHYFFVRKTMFLKYAEGFVIFPGGFGTMDELFESLTLIQTDKVRNFPVVLYSSDYWQGLLDWLRQKLLGEGKISKEDLDLIYVADTPKEAVNHILRCAGDKAGRESVEEDARKGTRKVLGARHDSNGM